MAELPKYKIDIENPTEIYELQGDRYSLKADCLTPDKAKEYVKILNAHDDLLAACKADAFLADIAISATPTGEIRNKLTEINILRLQAIAKAEKE